jgi:mono/diheme cytochrome c family protein
VSGALGGKVKLPPLPPRRLAVPLVDRDFLVVESKAERGAEIFGTYCAICHGGGAVASAMAPDLRASAVPLDAAAFAEVVRAGGRAPRCRRGEVTGQDSKRQQSAPDRRPSSTRDTEPLQRFTSG